MDSRKEVGHSRVDRIPLHLTLNPMANRPYRHYPAVPIADVIWLDDFMHNGRLGEEISFEQAVHILKRKQFPFFYDPYPWVSVDNTTGCLKSLLAQYIFKYKINQWKTVGVDFVYYGYFPEFDERTGEFFHESEGHGHLLKRLTNSFREGCIHGIDLQYFVDTLRYWSNQTSTNR